jgi:alanine racemase
MTPAPPGPRAVATVDLQAIGSNLARLRTSAGQRQLMAVVKADAYGHGVAAVAPAARASGADWLGVALPSEALALRQAGDSGPLMAWLFVPGEDLAPAVGADVDLSASAPWAVAAIADAARRTGRRARLHLKVDTGLGRSGAAVLAWPDLVSAALEAERSGYVEVVGAWSHLACGDEPDLVVTRQQCEVFDDALRTARALGLEPQLRHIAASGATLLDPDAGYDMVRCGIAVYGLAPGPAMGTSAGLGLTPAMTVTAAVAGVKRVPKGQGVSYGLTYRTARAATLALVPVGYADGVPRQGSGVLPVQINGKRFTVAGRIAMDQFVVDVGDHAVAPGDAVVLFGADPEAGPTADDWAAACGTINYEIVTRLGARVPRRHVPRPHARTGR